MTNDLLATAREAFGWAGDINVTPGPRGAMGQIWRIDTVAASYALKEIFAEPPSEDDISAELAFSRLAASAGVRLPGSHPDRQGRFLITTPAGNSLRLYDWIDLRLADLAEPATPRQLGVLLARLHRCAPAIRGPLDPWYDRLPTPDVWEPAASSDTLWASRLADRLADLPGLYAAAAPADPTTFVVCHRDLHPENVLSDPAGDLVVVDWDNLGPADPARELARALFDWFCDPIPDLTAMAGMYTAYMSHGGPGRITSLADFTMLIATRLNFLHLQTGIALNPHSEYRHRTFAEREIDQALRVLPPSEHLAAVLDMVQKLPG